MLSLLIRLAINILIMRLPLSSRITPSGKLESIILTSGTSLSSRKVIVG